MTVGIESLNYFGGLSDEDWKDRKKGANTGSPFQGEFPLARYGGGGFDIGQGSAG
ncbi:hypothetical protein PITCH_A450001 [uncultured Desulfobacterium sp.]|uniref:Uncharacterized protein n=1 Tax=uncultured Desulfobacterium sp. TaxID=201089 RepID=A0A445N0E9_9BACT|nr:hypothetical protein PITCH_A450001 [uncultured Desulfobacterium sp.]